MPQRTRVSAARGRPPAANLALPGRAGTRLRRAAPPTCPPRFSIRAALVFP